MPLTSCIKYAVLMITLTIPCFGQEIERILFTSQQIDEPPTKQGRPEYTIEFIHQGGDFVSSGFNENKMRKKLKDRVTIERERVEKMVEWAKLNKVTFSQSDLGIDVATIKHKAKNYKLNFDVPSDLVVKVDSFEFCQTYKMTKSISTGGEMLAVTLMYKTEQKQEFIFDSNDIEEGSFNLKNYILCYTLFKDKIPNEVPGYGFFSKDKLTDIVLYYQKTVECEGFYYKEFTEKNPDMTSKDKRMMASWNFIEYIEHRNKK